MQVPTEADSNKLLEQFEEQGDGAYRAGVLMPLNSAVTLFSLVGLIITLLPPPPVWQTILVVGTSLGINLLVFWLTNRAKAGLASYIFCIWINIGIYYFICVNLFREENLQSSTIFSCVLAICILLSGMLLGKRVGVVFAFVNSLFVFTIHLIYFAYYAIPEYNPFQDALSVSLPITFLLFMVAVVSYLYQRALALKDARLRVAREHILDDELLRREMAMARAVQQQLFPPPPVTNGNIKVAALSQPARETSGDFYDYIELGADRLGIVIADVTGKGMAAALVMAMARSAIRSAARQHNSPAEVLHQANLTLCDDRSVQQILTCFYGVLDLNTMELRFANAGHPYPIVRRNGTLSEHGAGGFPLGASPESHYDDLALLLEPGDQLILVSDGAFEERNTAREIFGFPRMNEVIAGVAGDDPHQTVAAIKQSVDRFRGSREQSDDLTLIAIQFQAHAAAVGEARDLAPATPQQTVRSRQSAG